MLLGNTGNKLFWAFCNKNSSGEETLTKNNFGYPIINTILITVNKL